MAGGSLRCAGACTSSRLYSYHVAAAAAAAVASGTLLLLLLLLLVSVCGPSRQPNHPPRARRRRRHQPLVAARRHRHRHRLHATRSHPFNTLPCGCGCGRLLQIQETAGVGADEAAEGAAGAPAGGQLRHGRHHAALPLRPHLHQGALLLHPLPRAAGAGGGGGGGGRRGLRQHAVQEGRADRGGGLRPEPADVLRDEQAVGAVRGGGGHPRRRQPLHHLHQPAGPRVEDEAVRAAARRRGHGRRPGVHAGALRRRERHRRAAALHPEPLRPGLPLLQRRLRRQPVPRLRRRALPAVHQHEPLRRRGGLPRERAQGLVGGQVHAPVPAALEIRRGGRRQRRGGALLPADLHRRDVPQGHGHRPQPRPRRRDRGRLPARPPARLPAGARRGVAHRRAAAAAAAAADHLAEELAAVHERARHGARRRGGELRRAHRGAGQPHGHAQLRAAGELGGRDGGRARRRADEHGVPASPRRGGAGGAVRGAGVAHPRDLQGPRRRHGRHLHGVQRVAGGELAAGPLPQRPLLPPPPLRRPQEGLGRHQDRLPRQAERPPQPLQVHRHARPRAGTPAIALTHCSLLSAHTHR